MDIRKCASDKYIKASNRIQKVEYGLQTGNSRERLGPGDLGDTLAYKLWTELIA